jgi:hypothetical protein
MLGRQERGQEELFVAGSMRDLVPDDYLLKRVDKVLDLSWLRDEVRELYDERMGRPGIDPEAAVRLMLAGFFHGITEDRTLMVGEKPPVVVAEGPYDRLTGAAELLNTIRGEGRGIYSNADSLYIAEVLLRAREAADSGMTIML